MGPGLFSSLGQGSCSSPKAAGQGLGARRGEGLWEVLLCWGTGVAVEATPQ